MSEANRRFTAIKSRSAHYAVVDALGVKWDGWPSPALVRIMEAEGEASVAAVKYIRDGGIEDEIAYRRALAAAENVWRAVAQEQTP